MVFKFQFIFLSLYHFCLILSIRLTKKDLDENESTADQTHFQVIDRQIRIFVFFEHLLCRKRFSSVRCTRNQYDHFFLVKMSVSVSIFLSCFCRPFGDEIRLRICICIPVMLILFSKPELQGFIFFCHGRMLVQIITKVQFIIVPGVPQMDMIYFIRKSVFSISLIK